MSVPIANKVETLLIPGCDIRLLPSPRREKAMPGAPVPVGWPSGLDDMNIKAFDASEQLPPSLSATAANLTMRPKMGQHFLVEVDLLSGTWHGVNEHIYRLQNAQALFFGQSISCKYPVRGFGPASVSQLSSH